MSERIVTEDNTPLTDVVVELPPLSMTTMPVKDCRGVVIGHANVQFTPAMGVQLRFLIDQHTPEAFDLELEKGHVSVSMTMYVVDGVLSGVITLLSC